MNENGWWEETARGISIFRPTSVPSRTLVAFSGRGVAPEDTDSPTAFLARRFAAVLGYPDLPIAHATQAHGTRSARVEEAPAAGQVTDAGQCDILVTDRPGLALVVQTADCVPMVFNGPQAVAVAHTGWRGSARNAAGATVAALRELGAAPDLLRVWLGPSIGPCCYEVRSDVANQFADKFAQASGGGRFHLDLRAVNRVQLETAGVPPENILIHTACTKCGGTKFASYRRDGAASGRMIALVARFASPTLAHAGVKSA